MVQNEPELHGFRQVVVIIMVVNRWQRAQESLLECSTSGRRGKSSFFHHIIFRKNTLVTKKSNVILRVRGLPGCCSRGFPGGSFGRFLGAGIT